MSIALNHHVAEIDRKIESLEGELASIRNEVIAWLKECRIAVSMEPSRADIRKPLVIPPFPEILKELGLEEPDGGADSD